MSIFKNPGNYFFSIWFEWKDIYKELGIPKDEQSDFVINEKIKYESPNANDNSGLGIISNSAVFEYYVIPNSLRNGPYSYSSIYDQQLKRFFETPNINYGKVLYNNKTQESINCQFAKNIYKDKAGFSISPDGDNRRTLIILFDGNYLNLKNSHTEWGKPVLFDVYIVKPSINHQNDEQNIEKISLGPDVIHITINVQSQDDAQVSPISRIMMRYLKNNGQ